MRVFGPFYLVVEVVNILSQLLGLCTKSDTLINNPLIEALDKVFDIAFDTEETLGHLRRTVMLFLLASCSVIGGVDEGRNTNSKLLQRLNGGLAILFSLDILNLSEVDPIEACDGVSYSNKADKNVARLRNSTESVATSID